MGCGSSCSEVLAFLADLLPPTSSLPPPVEESFYIINSQRWLSSLLFGSAGRPLLKTLGLQQTFSTDVLQKFSFHTLHFPGTAAAPILPSFFPSALGMPWPPAYLWDWGCFQFCFSQSTSLTKRLVAKILLCFDWNFPRFQAKTHMRVFVFLSLKLLLYWKTRI